MSKKTRATDDLAYYRFIFGNYHNQAKYRGMTFNLQLEDFMRVSMGDCAYCGSVAPLKTIKSKGFLYVPFNGIDRVDNAIGYVLENCVSCCTLCNFMKKTMSIEDFASHIKKIYNYNGGFNEKGSKN